MAVLCKETVKKHVKKDFFSVFRNVGFIRLCGFTRTRRLCVSKTPNKRFSFGVLEQNKQPRKTRAYLH